MDLQPRYHVTDLLTLATSLFGRGGLAEYRARIVAEVLVEADLLGYTTHGLDMLPRYLRELAEGRMTCEGGPVVVHDNGSVLTWDGQRLPGPWLVKESIAEALTRIGRHAVVTVAIRRSHHIGCLQAYLKPVTDEGLVILLMTSDPSGGGVAPHGGVSPVITPNPLAAGLPTAGMPILIDVSMSTTTNAMAARAHSERRPFPGDWVVDAEGRASRDPAVLFDEPRGAILPLGGLDLGHKGFALALLVDALTSGLAGFGRAEGPKDWGASVFLQILDPQAFGGRSAFLRETSRLAELCRESRVPPGRPPVRLPGERALAHRAHQLHSGVWLHPRIMPAVAEWAERLKVSLPEPIEMD